MNHLAFFHCDLISNNCDNFWDLTISWYFCSFNQLCLPTYDSYEELHKLLKLAISEGSEGFGMLWPHTGSDFCIHWRNSFFCVVCPMSELLYMSQCTLLPSNKRPLSWSPHGCPDISLSSRTFTWSWVAFGLFHYMLELCKYVNLFCTVKKKKWKMNEGRIMLHFILDGTFVCPVIKICKATITFGINKAGNIHMECSSL